MKLSVFLLGFAAVASAQNTVDIGNGVHVPGAIPANLFAPQQHRLAYAGSGMTVSWSTFVQLEQPQVLYGLRPDRLTKMATSTLSTTYPTSRTWNNHVKLDDLEHGTKYYYQVSYSNCAYCAYLPTYSFTTALAPGDMTPYSVAVMADLGLMGQDGLSTRAGPLGDAPTLGANETNTIQSLLALKDTYEFVAQFGDIGYADYFLKAATQGYYGTSSEKTMPTKQEIADRYESLSEQFFDQMRPVTAEKPWMVSPGNHEANCNNGGVTDKLNNITYTADDCLIGQTNFTFFIEHFKMPSYESGGRSNFWFSWDHGMVHYVSLDTETDLGHGLTGGVEDNKPGNSNGPFGLMNEQIQWLENDLKNVDRELTPWVVVGLHRPWYISVGAETAVYPAWQEAFEQLFYDYGVDLYLSGHVHVYERFNPMHNGTVDANGLDNPRAPWPIVNGAAGHYDGLDVLDPVDERHHGSAFGIDGTFGWGRLNFENRTHVTYEFVASANGSVLDTATLYKAHEF